MPTTTTNYGFTKPLPTEYVDLAILNDNLDLIDNEIKKVSNVKAPLASPTFTGTPAAPTWGSTDNSTRLATTAFVQAVKNTITSESLTNIQADIKGVTDAPSTYPIGISQTYIGVSGINLLNQWLSAVGLASGSYRVMILTYRNSLTNGNYQEMIVYSSSNIIIGKYCRATIDNSTWGAWIKIAIQSDLDLKAPLASPAFTGTPTAPTAPVNTNTTRIATTEFVQAVKNTITSENINITTLNKLPTDLPSTYPKGISIFYSNGSTAWKSSLGYTGTDGECFTVETMIGYSNYMVQRVTMYSTTPYNIVGIYERATLTGDTWGAWTRVVQSSTVGKITVSSAEPVLANMQEGEIYLKY